jgi:hypothetical protein
MLRGLVQQKILTPFQLAGALCKEFILSTHLFKAIIIFSILFILSMQEEFVKVLFIVHVKLLSMCIFSLIFLWCVM